MQEIILASSNQGKIEEFKHVLNFTQYRIKAQDEFGIPVPEETGLTFVENAILKARNACHYTGLPAIADDSGIEVDALQGKPGIYSARYAGHNASGADNIKKLLQELLNVPQNLRSASFQCVIVYLRHEFDPSPLICHGTWHGSILFEPVGEKGFGYDPIFFVPTHNCSAAELSLVIKNQISHRAQALNELIRLLVKQAKS